MTGTMDTQVLVIQLRYSAWATKRVLESTASIPQEEFIRDLGNSKFNETENAGGLYGTLSHIYQADAIWFDRLMGNPTSNLSAYDAPVEHAALSKLWLAVHDRYISWAEKLDAADWDRVVTYKNFKGEPFQTPVWQIVLHVVNHATHHRGQVVTMLRQLGRTPTSIDLILYYRETSRA
jgi:uncharacterized damage-inducible protein DinB